MQLDEKIPNNVNLSEDKRLQRALERWQPSFLEWWQDMGLEAQFMDRLNGMPKAQPTRNESRFCSRLESSLIASGFGR